MKMKYATYHVCHGALTCWHRLSVKKAVPISLHTPSPPVEVCPRRVDERLARCLCSPSHTRSAPLLIVGFPSCRCLGGFTAMYQSIPNTVLLFSLCRCLGGCTAMYWSIQTLLYIYKYIFLSAGALEDALPCTGPYQTLLYIYKYIFLSAGALEDALPCTGPYQTLLYIYIFFSLQVHWCKHCHAPVHTKHYQTLLYIHKYIFHSAGALV